ncbi:MAG: rhomboid family intramembrane serine protease, partial [candidate division NC10 bacterium]
MSIQTPEATERRRAQAPRHGAQTPSLDRLARTAAAWGDEHPDAVHVLKLTALLPVLVALRVAVPDGFFALLSLAAVVSATCLILHLRSAETGHLGILRDYLTFLDVPQLEGPDRRPELPVGTYGLIAITVAVFYCVQPQGTAGVLRQNLVFLPRNPTWVNTPLSAIVHLFLHADSDHLWGNMLWLWALGRVVERRLGCGTFLAASGAISGIMGIYLIRCHFKAMVFPLPLLEPL